MSSNSPLHLARRQERDEFYTQRVDIENELYHYRDHFRGKVVYCNCDDPRVSEFTRYFREQFEFLGLRKLIVTCYKNQNLDMFSRHDDERAIGLMVTSEGEQEIHLEGDGDFRSDECVEFLQEADIVVTNPPFSLFREYVAQIMEHEKRFVIIGPWNAVTYKEIFPLIKENRFWLGYGFASGNAYFSVPSDTAEYATGVYDEETGLVKFRNVTWFTNLPHRRRNEELKLYKRYSPEKYPKYDNYDAINVDRVAHIPEDYDGAMGVPITFLDKYNPEQFEIIKFRKGNDDDDLRVGDKYPYFRIVIRNRRL